MTYVSQAVAAKTKARDILRTKMATRILERRAVAADAFKAAIKSYANLVSSFTRSDENTTKMTEEREAKRIAFFDALETVPGISDEERADIADAARTAQAANDKADEEDKVSRSKVREEDLKEAADNITEARKELARHDDNLAKLESGEMKVNKEELDALTAELITSGRVEAGQAEEGTEGALEAEEAE